MILNPNALPPSQRTVYEAIDRPYIATIIELETSGVMIDIERLSALSIPMNARIQEVEEQLKIVADKPDFNPASYPQCAWLVYDHLGFQESRKPGKERSTEAEIIEPYRRLHAGVDLLWEHRKLAKMRGTYIDKLPRVLKNGRVHTHFNIAGTETGRLSSSSPINLQNIPKRVLPGTPPFIEWLVRGIRDCFVARSGYQWVKFDQQAVELRVLACLADESSIIEAVRAGRDVHLDTVAAYLQEPYTVVAGKRKAGDQGVEDLRDLFKNINYGLVYGISEQSTADYATGRGIAMTLERAGELHRLVWDRIPRVEAWMGDTRTVVLSNGWTTTHFGRRLEYPDARLPGYGRTRHLVTKAFREAINGRIQGTSADVMKILQNNIRRERKARGLVGTRQVLAIHDEADYEVPEDEVDSMVALIKELGPQVVNWQIPLDVDVGVGSSWGQTTKV